MMENFKASKEAEIAANLGYGDRFNSWLMLGGLNKLMGENCAFKGAIALGGGWALGGMFGAFLAPFDTMGGLRVRPPQTHFARVCHPEGNPGANLKPISHRCHPILVAFLWELTKYTIVLPLG